jgi:hypothetical protein
MRKVVQIARLAQICAIEGQPKPRDSRPVRVARNVQAARPPRSERGLDAAVAAGVLGPILTSTAAGFGPLVLKVPVRESGH